MTTSKEGLKQDPDYKSLISMELQSNYDLYKRKVGGARPSFFLFQSSFSKQLKSTTASTVNLLQQGFLNKLIEDDLSS